MIHSAGAPNQMLTCAAQTTHVTCAKANAPPASTPPRPTGDHDPAHSFAPHIQCSPHASICNRSKVNINAQDNQNLTPSIATARWPALTNSSRTSTLLPVHQAYLPMSNTRHLPTRHAPATHSPKQVDINAQENRLTGAALLTDAFVLVVVEGCAKSQRRYEKLMLRRIDWSMRPDGGAGDGDEDVPLNYCHLVWQVSTMPRALGGDFGWCLSGCRGHGSGRGLSACCRQTP